MELQTDEEAKRIIGFEDNYIITSFGRIWSIKRNMFLKPSKDRYITITLYNKEKKRSTSLHRLVCEAFKDNEENKPYVNHIDGNKHNNNILNLEWVTASENDIHAVKFGLKKNSEKQRKWARKHGKTLHEKTCKPIKQLTKKGKEIMIFKSIREASRAVGVKHQSIIGAIKRNGTSAGYKWEVV